MSAINIIKAYAKKQLTKNRGSGIMELPSDMLAGTEAGKILITLQKAGMPVQQLDDFIRSEKDLVKFLNIIESTSKPRVLSGDEAAKFLNKAFPPKGKLIPFPQKRNFAEEIEAMKKSGDLVDPDNLKKSQKVTDREMFKEANERFKKKEKPKPIDPDFYDGPFDNKAEELAEIKMSNEGFIADAVARITSMEPVAALKEANKVIRREGIYKNLDETQSKKILTDSEDWIFQKDPNDLYDYNKNRPFRDDPDFDPDDPDYQDFLKNRDRDDYYTGGMVDVEPNLSDIGHGSDALMARTRLISPGAQGTTSTGLNYLLAEDNDNIRVPFSEAGIVDPFTAEDKAFKDAMKAFRYYQIHGGKKNFKNYMRLQSQAGKAGGGIENFRAEGGRIGFKEGNGVYDEEKEKKLLGKRVRELMDDGYEFGEAVKEAMKEGYADGGRIGFKTGTDQSKRAFLKLLAALGGGIATLKSGLLSFGGKGATKKLLSPIQTDNVPGKPEWFDALVNKVILEGDEVTKKFATKEREIVHMKKIDDDNTVMVYQDLDDGAVRVDYDAPTNMGEDTVSLQYKKPLPDEGDPNPKPEFEASELEPRYVGGPEDADIEFDGLGGGSSIKMLESDVSKLKEYATGQKPTMKEFIESKKRKDAVNAINKDQMEQAEYIAGKYGDGPEPPDDIDFASGGRAGFSSGKLATQTLGITGSSRRFLEKVFGKEGFENIIRTDPDMYKGMLEVVEMFRNRNKEGLKMYLQKYLPHMDDEMIEDFIVGGGGSEGIQGQLIRLGSGRDYAQKLEMMKKADQMKKLGDLEVTDEMVRKPNASGGIAKLLGE